jgi:hypothetical protein
MMAGICWIEGLICKVLLMWVRRVARLGWRHSSVTSAWLRWYVRCRLDSLEYLELVNKSSTVADACEAEVELSVVH